MLIRWKKDKGASANSGSNKSSTKKKRKFGREGKVVVKLPFGRLADMGVGCVDRYAVVQI